MFRWTPPPYRGRINSMFSTRSILGQTERPRSADAHWLPMSMLIAGVYLCLTIGLWAQSPDSQAPDTNQSWTTTTESQRDDVNPTRSTESHTKNGNRTLDKQSLERRGLDGRFE